MSLANDSPYLLLIAREGSDRVRLKMLQHYLLNENAHAIKGVTIDVTNC